MIKTQYICDACGRTQEDSAEFRKANRQNMCRKRNQHLKRSLSVVPGSK